MMLPITLPVSAPSLPHRLLCDACTPGPYRIPVGGPAPESGDSTLLVHAESRRDILQPTKYMHEL